jgi:hypothetical integral membrane protein (TIGR02206 family)
MGHVLLLGQPAVHSMPLHICGVSIYTVSILLIFRTSTLFSFSFYAGLSGAIQAILTPDVGVGFPHFLFITYFTSHISILIGVSYAMIVYEMRPDLWGLRNAVIITNLYAVFIFFVNHILDTNYLFLQHKPKGETLMDIMGPWPIYIAWLEVSMLVSFSILYFLYRRIANCCEFKS